MLIGLLNAQYTLTGYDASAHMSEETHDAERSAPKGIIWSVIISVIAGFILLVAMNIGITPDKVFQAADGTAIDGYAHALARRSCRPAQIWIDAVGQTGGLFILFLVIGAQFFCGMSSVTANSRMIYAFARDGAIPGQQLLAPDQPADTDANQLDLAGRGRRVHPRRAVPVEPDRLLRDHVDRGHRPVRRLRLAGLPPGPGRRPLQGGTVDARQAGADRSGSSRPSGSRSSSSCSCCRRSCPSRPAPSAT